MSGQRYVEIPGSKLTNFRLCSYIPRRTRYATCFGHARGRRHAGPQRCGQEVLEQRK